MKNRFIAIVLVAILICTIGNLTFPSRLLAVSGPQQIWFIDTFHQLVDDSGTSTASWTINNDFQIPCSQAVGSGDAVSFSSGFWHGYLALQSAYTEGHTGACIRLGTMNDSNEFSSICSMVSSGTYHNGISLTFEADPFQIPENSRLALKFDGLYGNPVLITGGNRSYLISPPGSPCYPDPDVTAAYNLSIAASGNGTTQPSATGSPYEYYNGCRVPLSATAAANNHFSGWSGDLTGSDNPAIVTMSGNKYVTANFAADVSTPLSTTTSLSSSKSPTSRGENVTFTALVTPVGGSGTPTGNVTFFADNITLGNGISHGSGHWTLATAALSIGTHNITAGYAGDTNFSASTSAAIEQQVVDDFVPIVLSPDTATLVTGDYWDVILQIQSGSQPVVGIDAYVNFNPTCLRVVDMDGSAAGVQITPGTTLNEIIQNTADNGTGHIDFSAGVLGGSEPYPSGTFTLATIRFQALSPTSPTTSITFSTSGLRKTYISGDITGSDVTGTLGSGTCTIVAGVSVDIAVGLQGASRPDAAWQIPLTVKFFTPGADVLSATAQYTFTLTASKENSTARVCCICVQPGSYDISIGSAHTLINVKRNITISLTSYQVYLGTLLEGNANNNEVINIVDFSILAGAYNKNNGEPGYNAMADFDGNGRVSMADFSLLSGNYTRVSPVEIP
jgi:hypothetical protein